MEKVTQKIADLKLAPAAPPKQKPGTLGTPTEIATNAVKLSLSKNLVIYKYDVAIDEIYDTKSGELAKSLTKGPKNDTDYHVRITKAKKALAAAIEKSKAKLKNSDMFYDNASNLYSFSKFGKVEVKVNVSDVTCDPKCKEVKVSINPVDQSFQVTTNDLPKTVNSKFGAEDRTLLEAINVIVSGSCERNPDQISYKGVHYVFDPTTAGFRQNDLPALPGGQYAGVGLGESVKCFEGGSDGLSLYATSDVKKSAFHVDNQPLYNKFSDILSSRRQRMSDKLKATSQEAFILKKLTKGMVVRLNYGEQAKKGIEAQRFKIGGFGESAADKTFESNGKKITIAAYFKQKYGITLKYPHLFTVYDAKKRDVLFPVEVLCVAENQRVRIEHQTDRGQQDMIKVSAVAPDLRKTQTKNLNEAIGICQQNKDLAAIGVTFNKDAVVVPGRIMPSAQISTGGRPNEVRGNSWMANSYLKPAAFPKWIVATVATNINVDRYIPRIRERAIQCRMQWQDPVYKDLKSGGEVEGLMKFAKDNQFKYVLFICRDSLNIHEEIKSLEQRYDVLTQEIRESKASAVIERGQPQTVQNVVHKMNLKLGGANWKVDGYAIQNTDFLGKGRLFIGLEASRSLGGEAVAVGYSANAGPGSYQNFIGGFKYVKPTDQGDVYGEVLSAVVKEMVLEAKSHWPAPPAHLYFYFNGVSEGEFNKIASKYVQTIKDTCGELNANYKPHITVFAVSKKHSERLYKKQITGAKVAEKNIQPGTVVDSVIVNPAYNEFYLNSHSAFQGSAKTPKFSHIFDTSKLTMNEHEGIAHQLCFLMGIVSSTISLPAPVMIADRYAKRASMLYGQRSANGSIASGGSGNIDIETLNKELTYGSDHSLSHVRFNA